MEIEQLYYFKTIVEEKSYTKAAYKLNISQSSLSKQILKLEDELQVKLFNREKRAISLTSYGEIVYRDCKKILSDKEKMIEHIKNQKNEIHISTFPFFYQYQLEERIQKFNSKFPELKIILNEIEEHELESSLQSDILFIRGQLDNEQEYTKYCIDQDSMIAVVGKENSFYQNEMISLKDIKDEKILCMSKYTRIAQLCTKVCHENKIHDIEYGKIHSIISLAQKNKGIILTVFKSLEGYDLKNCKIIPLKENITSDINLYIHKESSQYDKLIQLADFF